MTVTKSGTETVISGTDARGRRYGALLSAVATVLPSGPTNYVITFTSGSYVVVTEEDGDQVRSLRFNEASK